MKRENEKSEMNYTGHWAFISALKSVWFIWFASLRFLAVGSRVDPSGSIQRPLNSLRIQDPCRFGLGLVPSFVLDFLLCTPLDLAFYTSCMSKFCAKTPNKFLWVLDNFLDVFIIFLHNKTWWKICVLILVTWLLFLLFFEEFCYDFEHDTLVHDMGT